MSIKLMGKVWEKDLSHSEQSILLSMADYADDDGRNCYPSYDRLAWKTGYSKRQVQRIIAELCTKGILFVVKSPSQHQSTHYWIRLDKAQDKPAFVRVDISDTETRVDNLSTLNNDDESSIDKLSTLNESRVDICDTEGIQSGHLEHPEWTFATSRVDMVSTDPSVNHHIEPTEEKEETHARDPLSIAWRQAYADVTMPPVLEKSLQSLVAECGMAATIHGIKASAAKEGGRNFRYIAECARNYIPPAPMASYANGNPYTIDIPGIVELPALQQTSAPLPPPLPAMAHDDPWAVCLSELQGSLPGVALGYLEGSHIEEAGDVEGVPLYRVVCDERAAAGLSWLTTQAGPAIRRKLGSVLRKSVVVEITVAEKELA